VTKADKIGYGVYINIKSYASIDIYIFHKRTVDFVGYAIYMHARFIALIMHDKTLQYHTLTADAFIIEWKFDDLGI